MSIEIWRDIPNYEGLYQISNFGRVKSLSKYHSRKEIVMILRDNMYGYLTVGLSKNNKTKRIKVHKLVMDSFNHDRSIFKYAPNENISDIDLNKLEINHIDGNKHNNNVANLEWCTKSYNSIHSYKNKLHKNIPVNQFSLNGELIKTWFCAKVAAKELGIYNSNIVHCCRHKRKQTGGYMWEYAKEGD